MAALYTPEEFRWLDEKAQARGDAPTDLVLCSDGVMRPEAEAIQFEKHAEAEAARRLIGVF